MATTRVTCPTCKTQLEIDAQYEGEEVECGSCLQVFVARTPRPTFRANPDRAAEADAPPRPPRRRTRRDDDEDDDDARSPADGGTAATFALVLGIAAIVTACCPLTGIVFGIVAIVCGSIGAKNPGTKALAVTGTVLGSIGLLFGIVSLAWFVIQG